ncbi:MAG: SusC/RagA family TonB-linked outer membrane protein, partial [Bacteroidales bacterium]|nr:SusC/RagA family TonB-linked outer membrane protein [Bacteroidales bacterium]
MMKKFYTYIILPLLLCATAASAQEVVALSQMDSIVLGNQYKLAADGNVTLGQTVFDKSPEIDIAKALYGQFSGLLVKQGSGRSEENQSKLRLHGHSPLVLVDGLP